MLEPWNDSSILAPPINTFLSINNIDFNDLTYAVQNAIEILSKQSPLHKESAILSRLVYKFDKKFRHDIGYRGFKKVHTALRKYLALNLLKDFETFSSVIPKSDEKELYLPTRQMLEYLLTRLMCFSKLMLRIIVCSKQSATFYFERVKRSESFWMSLMPYALLSRIWSMTQVLLQHSCNWYNQLYPMLEYLELKGIHFLPPNYTLPSDLEEWLDIKNVNGFSCFEWTNKVRINVSKMLMEDENIGNVFDNILDYVSQINDGEENSNVNEIKMPSVHEISYNNIVNKDNCELGVAISRNDLNEQNIQNLKPNTNSKLAEHSIDAVTNSNTLNEFLSIEEDFRNSSSKESLTSHLTFMQWQALKLSLLNLNSDKIVNRKLVRKIKKIWQEKCLDYK